VQQADAGHQWHDQHQRQHQQRHQQQHQQQHQQRHQHPFAHHMQPQPFNLHPPFNGFFPIPPIPAMPKIPPLILNPPYPPPPTSVHSMFPTTSPQHTNTPTNQSSTTSSFPGGQSTTSSYSIQQGNTVFQYSSSNTSMKLEPGAQFSSTMQPGFPAVAQSIHIMPPAPLLQQQPTLLQHQPHHQYQHQQQQPTTQPLLPQSHELPIRPRDHHSPIQDTATPSATTTTAAVQPEPLFNPVMEEVVDQEPQNPRLAETFRQQLEADEATYFSPVPGRADRRVER
jgi:hypothetical protein